MHEYVISLLQSPSFAKLIPTSTRHGARCTCGFARLDAAGSRSDVTTPFHGDRDDVLPRRFFNRFARGGFSVGVLSGLSRQAARPVVQTEFDLSKSDLN